MIILGPLPLPYQRISDSLRALPDVDFVEPFDQEDVIIADHQTRVFGVPATTHLYHAQLVAGRWLNEHEPDTLVISDVAAQRLNAHVGDTITLTPGTRKVSWKIVGIVHDLAYASGSSEPHGRLGAMFTTLDNMDMTLRHVPERGTR
jgi:ABC-type lipoprotein release transport system permease subunit